MRKKKLLVALLAVVLVFAMSATALASDIQPYRASDYLGTYGASITAQANKQMRVYFSVVATGLMDEVGADHITIEKKVNGVWTYDRTISHEDDGYEHMMTSNAAGYAAAVYFTGTVGVEYRATVTVYAGDSTGSDTGDVTTEVNATCRQ